MASNDKDPKLTKSGVIYRYNAPASAVQNNTYENLEEHYGKDTRSTSRHPHPYTYTHPQQDIQSAQNVSP